MSICGSKKSFLDIIERPPAYKEGSEIRFLIPQILDISLTKGNKFCFPLSPEKNSFVYLYEGEIKVGRKDNERLKGSTLILLSKGETLYVEAVENAEFLLISGRPINEDIVRGGPFVMNTREEILEAIEDYRNGTFIK